MSGNAPAPVRPGEELDWDALETYLRAQLTYLLRFGDTELVLPRPPFGVVAPGAHDMKREFRVQSKLWRSFDRAGRLAATMPTPTRTACARSSTGT